MSEYSLSKISITKYEQLVKVCNKVIDVFLIIALVAMATVVIIQVIFRYVFISPLSWPEEITRLILVWLTFLGGYVAFRENQHMSFNVLVKKIPRPYRTIVQLIRECAVILFITVIIIEGTKFSLKFRSVNLTYVDISLGLFAYSVFPVAGSCMLCKSIVTIYRFINTEFGRKR